MSAAAVVDCDVHVPAPDLEELASHLDGYWLEYAREAGFRQPSSLQTVYPAGAPTTRRPDADPSLAGLAAHLDAEGATEALVHCFSGLEAIKNPDFAGALASALNNWLAGEWLERDPRLRAVAVVAPDDPAGAAAEIARIAGDRRFVAVLLPVRSTQPYGNRRFWPLLEAAVAHNRPLVLHFGGSSGNPPTPVGWPSYYVEEYVGMAHIFAAQVTSLIAEGAFERFPDLRIALAEGGWSWIPPLMWRLDKEWKGLRREIPWVSRAPSETIRAHMRATLQPLDGPADGPGTLRLLEQIGAEEFLMFASDFPHRHLRSYEQTLAGIVPDGLDRLIRSETARRFYGL